MELCRTWWWRPSCLCRYTVTLLQKSKMVEKFEWKALNFQQRTAFVWRLQILIQSNKMNFYRLFPATTMLQNFQVGSKSGSSSSSEFILITVSWPHLSRWVGVCPRNDEFLCLLGQFIGSGRVQRPHSVDSFFWLICAKCLKHGVSWFSVSRLKIFGSIVFAIQCDLRRRWLFDFTLGHFSTAWDENWCLFILRSAQF